MLIKLNILCKTLEKKIFRFSAQDWMSECPLYLISGLQFKKLEGEVLLYFQNTIQYRTDNNATSNGMYLARTTNIVRRIIYICNMYNFTV